MQDRPLGLRGKRAFVDRRRCALCLGWAAMARPHAALNGIVYRNANAEAPVE